MNRLANIINTPTVQAEPLRWNRRLSKSFDVSREQFPARSTEEALVAKYLEVEIKHLERRGTRVPSVRMGAFLTAVNEVVGGWSVDDIRNLNYKGEETPPTYEIIQLNSTKSADFLVDGMRFLHKTDPDESRASVRVQPAWYGLDVTVYGLRSTGTAEKVLGEILQKSREINYLKGEAFSLSGEFLPKTDEAFSDLFLEPKNSAAMTRVVNLVNTRGKSLENRGVILMGPPGTGKTLAARIVRNEAKATFIWVSSRDFHYSGSFGGFSQAFDLARECAPSVVVFEDIDNWLYDTTVDLIKTEMDGVAKSTGVVTMMTTNYPEQLPAALIDRPGRFHDVLKFDLPNEDARKSMLERWLPGLSGSDMDRAVKATAGYSGAHVRELARFAKIIAEQDSLSLNGALTTALTKLAEQRELITTTQRTGSRYRMSPELTKKSTSASVGKLTRAYSLLRVKSIDTEHRKITGIATTPEPDRSGDVVDPSGVQFKNPLPLLLHHDKERPVGKVTFHPATNKGIAFEAVFPVVNEEGTLKNRIDEAWQSVKTGLISGVSIGFRALDDAVEIMKSGGLKFLKTEVLELSLVTIPANANATILTVKSLDLAASGHNTPGATGTLPVVRAIKDAPKMNTVAEQITAFEATRQARAAAMNTLMTKAAEQNITLDAEQTIEYDGLASEVKSIDAHLARLRDLEKANALVATRVEVTDVKTAEQVRDGVRQVSVKANVPKGTAFARMCMALAAGHGDSYQTLQYAKQWKDSTPEVEQMVQHMWTKAAVAVGTTTDSTWAGPLVVTQPLNEFLELLRPRTLLGRIPGLRQVPFNVSIPSQTTGGTYGWVGQNKPKPVTKADYSSVTVPFAKASGIIVLSEELVKLSTPSAENLVREEMIAGMGQFLDQQFVDPTVAAVSNVSPASITNGASTAAASGVTSAAAKADLAASVAVFTAAGIPLEGAVWLMSDSNAFGLSISVNALGQPLFPGMTAQGGTLMGIPVVVSNNVSNRVVLVHAPSILYADEGGVQIDVSREASIQMDSAPTDTVDASTVYLSLWQRNLVGLRAERMITWIRARSAAVRYISSAAYVGS